MNSWFKRFILAVILMCSVQGVFAQTSHIASATADDVVLTHDRFEKINRAVFAFNDGWDQSFFKPLANSYRQLMPKSGQSCVHGFFKNLKVPYTAVNNLLQGKFKAAGQDMCRFVINTTVGVVGCVDVAGKWHIPEHEEDFGQTLGVWGVPPGPFVMLPFLGPFTLRDAIARPVDYFANPVTYINPLAVQIPLYGMQLTDLRTQLMDATNILDDTAVDRYALMRDAYLQQREAEVRDENYAPDDIKPVKSSASVTESKLVGDDQVKTEPASAAPMMPESDQTKPKLVPEVTDSVKPVNAQNGKIEATAPVVNEANEAKEALAQKDPLAPFVMQPVK